MKSLWRGIVSFWHTTLYYLKSVGRDYFADDVFFHASALSFQVMLCLIPTVLLIIWVLGTFLSREAIMKQIEILSAYALPSRIHSVEQARRMFVSRAQLFTRHKELFGVLGLVGFFWTSLGLVSTLRKTIFSVLDIQVNMSFIRQTLYDLRLLLIAGFFLVSSTVVTTLFAFLREAAILLPHGHVRFALVRVAVPMLSGFGLTFLLYFFIYRFISYGRLRSSSAAFGALWAGILFELSKHIFTLYLTQATRLTEVYGALEVIIGLLIWIFYSSTVFIVGAELAHANLKRKALS